MLDVSVLQSGTRLTARQFQVSRSSLDRHKRHLQTVVREQAQQVVANGEEATPLLSQLDIMIRDCESVLRQAQANNNFPAVMRALKERRALFELKCKLVSEEQKHRVLPKDRPEQRSRANEDPQQSTADLCQKIEAGTLRILIRVAQRKLGEIAPINEPNDLEYLRKQHTALSARLEQRELLKQSAGLAGTTTYD